MGVEVDNGAWPVSIVASPRQSTFCRGGGVCRYLYICVCVWRHSFRLRQHPRQSLMGMETKKRVSKLSKIDDTVVQEIRPRERER